jgi:hypothetical protein
MLEQIRLSAKRRVLKLVLRLLRHLSVFRPLSCRSFHTTPAKKIHRKKFNAKKIIEKNSFEKSKKIHRIFKHMILFHKISSDLIRIRIELSWVRGCLITM